MSHFTVAFFSHIQYSWKHAGVEFIPIVKCVLISDLELYLITKISNLNFSIMEQSLARRLGGPGLPYH